DDDLLGGGPFALRYAHDFAARRRPSPEGVLEERARLYVVEARLSVTGGMADGRLAVKRSQVGDVAARVLREVLRALPSERGELSSRLTSALAALPESPHDGWAKAVARDLVAHPGESPVLVGDGQP